MDLLNPVVKYLSEMLEKDKLARGRLSNRLKLQAEGF